MSEGSRKITSHVWMLRCLSGKARGLRILRVWKGRATSPDGMDRRPNMGSYFCANPKAKRGGIQDTHDGPPTQLQEALNPSVRLMEKGLRRLRTQCRGFPGCSGKVKIHKLGLLVRHRFTTKTRRLWHLRISSTKSAEGLVKV